MRDIECKESWQDKKRNQLKNLSLAIRQANKKLHPLAKQMKIVIIISIQISMVLNSSRQHKEYKICEDTFNALSNKLIRIFMKKKLALAKALLRN